MRLLFISSAFPRPGDPARAPYNLRMCEALAEAHELRVISPVPWRRWRARRSGPQRVGALSDVWYPLFVYPPALLRDTHASLMRRCIANTLRQGGSFSPDAVLSYWTYPDGAAAAAVARARGVPVLMMVGGSDVEVLGRQPPHRERIARTLAGADLVIATSQSLCESVADLNVPANRIALVRRGVDLERFRPGDRACARRTLRLPVGTRVFLWVGRFDAVKGPHLLVDALACLRSSGGEEWKCYLVGEGPLRREVVSAIARLGLENHAVLVGHQPATELPAWYQAADAVVISSRSEGLPNVLIEAKACGARVVAGDVGGVRELAAGDDLLVPPDDPKALAAAMRRVLDAGSSRERRGHARVGLITWRQSAAALTALIDQATFRNSSAVVQASVVRGTR